MLMCGTSDVQCINDSYKTNNRWLCSVLPYVSANTIQVIWEMAFTGQKTKPTASKY